jgi:2-polyprenyl-3-methyl-5-hydroxy-6-metoxy-1,4-benzoquinol methylase
MQHEALGACPVCGSATRTLLHAALADDSFRAVAGSWSLWRCGGCGNGYLDPRPDRASIGQAYQRYYTHAATPTAAAPALSWRGRVRLWMEDGYLQRRYGAPRPATALGAWLYGGLLPWRHASDTRWRHLPGPGRGRRLLDLGCGDGAFLRQAQAGGWQVQGLDPDPQAVAEARRQGLPVREGGLEALAGQAGAFDLITLSHVIEHVHDPAALLADCHRLLKPGGSLWLATPNLDAGGHALFGRHWRGLEAPRHLVLFHEDGLRRLLAAAGFVTTRRLPSPLAEPFMLARASHAIASGLLPDEQAPPLPPQLRRAAWRLALQGLLRPRRRELLYLRALR